MDTHLDVAIRAPSPASPEADPAIRELDHRSNDGIEVRLLWNERTNAVSVAVTDERTGESFELDVRPEDALVAFHHPYAYSSRDGTDSELAA